VSWPGWHGLSVQCSLRATCATCGMLLTSCSSNGTDSFAQCYSCMVHSSQQKCLCGRWYYLGACVLRCVLHLLEAGSYCSPCCVLQHAHSLEVTRRLGRLQPCIHLAGGCACACS
jgi:hypothetical protein